MHEHYFTGRVEKVNGKTVIKYITTKGDFYLEVDMNAVLNGFMGKIVRVTIEEVN